MVPAYGPEAVFPRSEFLLPGLVSDSENLLTFGMAEVTGDDPRDRWATCDASRSLAVSSS